MWEEQLEAGKEKSCWMDHSCYSLEFMNIIYLYYTIFFFYIFFFPFKKTSLPMFK